MLRFSSLSLGEYGMMLQQPDLIWCCFISFVGKGLHLLPNGFVWLQPQTPNNKLGQLKHHMDTTRGFQFFKH